MKIGKLGLLSVGLTFVLSACSLLPGGNGPTINSFTASPSSIAPGESSTLTWSVDNTATSISISSVGDVTNDTSVTVTPTVTTVYTLTAVGPEGSSTETTTVTVVGGGGGGSGGGGGGGGGGETPVGTFGVSTSASGPFLNDVDDGGAITSDSDPRIISVAAGGTFYAQVAYSDPDGIANIAVNLVNDEPMGLAGTLNGTTPTGGFTLGEPTGDCDLSGASQTVTCVYPITVAPGTQDIEALPGAGNEFAYVFRANVTDGAGSSSGNTPSGQYRGYVNID